MIDTEWDEAAAWINLRWDRQPLDPLVAKSWFELVKNYRYDDVLRAINQLAIDRPIRPSISELAAATRAVAAGHRTPALPAYIPKTEGYGTAWYAVGVAAQEGQISRADLDALAEKHKRWFRDHGEDTKATAEMVAEVQGLASKASPAPTPAGQPVSPRGKDGRYGDAHKARYMAAVAEKERLEKEGQP